MDSLTEHLHGLLEQAVSGGEIAGANLLVGQHGEEIAYTEAGFADIESGRGFHRDTIARVYSMTKPITATAGCADGIKGRGRASEAEAITVE